MDNKQNVTEALIEIATKIESLRAEVMFDYDIEQSDIGTQHFLIAIANLETAERHIKLAQLYEP